MDYICLFLIMFFFWFGCSVVHPFPLGGLFLFLSLLAVGLISFNVGVFSAFAVWIVFIGGVLVVFGYTFSLVPFNRQEYKSELGIPLYKKNSGKEMNSLNKMLEGYYHKSSLWLGWLGLLGGVCLLVCLLVTFSYEKMGWSYFFRCEGFYYMNGWSVAVIALGCMLLGVMIGVVCITSSYKGALIK